MIGGYDVVLVTNYVSSGVVGGWLILENAGGSV